MRKYMDLKYLGLSAGLIVLLAYPAEYASASTLPTVQWPVLGNYGVNLRAWSIYSGDRHEKDDRTFRHKYKKTRAYKKGHGHAQHGFIAKLPSKRKKIVYNGETYYFTNGTYYKKIKNKAYQKVTAPFGASVRRLPAGYVKSYHNGELYYHYKGNYFVKGSSGYRIVKRPFDRHSDLYHGRHVRHYSHAGHKDCD